MDALELLVDEGRPANAGRFFQLGDHIGDQKNFAFPIVPGPSGSIYCTYDYQ